MTLARELFNFCDYFLRLSGFSDFFGKVSLINLKFLEYFNTIAAKFLFSLRTALNRVNV